VLLVAVALINTFILTKKSKLEETELLEKAKSKYLDRALQLFKNEFYSESILECYKILELTLRERLLQRNNIYTQYTSFSDLINLSKKNKIINEKLIPAIEELRVKRNNTAHSTKNYTKEDAKRALDTVRNVIEQIDNIQEILGTDKISDSRFLINNNFKQLEDRVKVLEDKVQSIETELSK